AATAALIWRRPGLPTVPDPSQWVQLTNFTDQSTDPSFSPDGRMLAFVRGSMGSAQLYVKLLPDGEPVQLTHDENGKLLPAFSPDGSRIAYGTSGLNWQTWVIPALGGQPQLLLSNATGLTWIDPKHVMFSEVKSGVHLSVVTATESRSEQRDVYVPPNENDMAHMSYLSPDRKWVLVVEMGPDHKMIPCQLVPFSGAGPPRPVGPKDGGCAGAAWSPDGKWMYLNSEAGSHGYHLWSQAFPDGVPQQLTASLAEEQGVAIAPDGRSLVTSVGTLESSVWVHDHQGERQVSSEGFSSYSRLSSDGGKLFYLHATNAAEADHGGELWAADLATGQASKVLPGLALQSYSLSPDDKQVVYDTLEENGEHHVWIASTQHRFAPRQLDSGDNASGPIYSPSGQIYCEISQAGRRYLYRINQDGTKKEKLSSEPILVASAVSPDGKFVTVRRPLNREDNWTMNAAVPVSGGPAIPLCSGWCEFNWTRDGKAMYVYWLASKGSSEYRTYVLPLVRGTDFPKLPSQGFQSEAEVRKAAVQVLDGAAFPGPDSSSYSVSKRTSHWNLYRIPLQ